MRPCRPFLRDRTHSLHVTLSTFNSHVRAHSGMATIFPLSSARLPRSLANKIQDLREDDEARGNLERRVAAYENEKAAATIQKMKSGLTPRQQLVQGIARKEGIADDHLPEEPKKSARKLVLKKESPRAAPQAPLWIEPALANEPPPPPLPNGGGGEKWFDGNSTCPAGMSASTF